MRNLALAIALVLIFAFSAKIFAQDTPENKELAQVKLELALTQRTLLATQAQVLQLTFQKAQAELVASFARNDEALKALGKDPAGYVFDAEKGGFVEKSSPPAKSDTK